MINGGGGFQPCKRVNDSNVNDDARLGRIMFDKKKKNLPTVIVEKF